MFQVSPVERGSVFEAWRDRNALSVRQACRGGVMGMDEAGGMTRPYTFLLEMLWETARLRNRVPQKVRPWLVPYGTRQKKEFGV